MTSQSSQTNCGSNGPSYPPQMSSPKTPQASPSVDQLVKKIIEVTKGLKETNKKEVIDSVKEMERRLKGKDREIIELKKRLEDQMTIKELSDEVKQGVNQMKELMNEQMEKTSEVARQALQVNVSENVIAGSSFAQILEENIPLLRQQEARQVKEKKLVKKSKHQVIIKGNDNQITSNDVRQQWKAKIKSNQVGLKIVKERNAGKNGVIIECNSSDDCNVLLDQLKEMPNMKAFLPKMKNPNMIIHGLPQDILDEDDLAEGKTEKEKLKEIILAKNEDVNSLITNENDFLVKFLKGKEGRRSAVIQVSPELRKLMLKKKKLFAFYGQLRVEDFTLMVRCYKCAGFSHFAKDCQSDMRCSECGSKDHKYSDCPKDRKECFHCVEWNNKGLDSVKCDVNHNALDSCCQKVKFMKARLEESVNYG
jgi:hypothetical protein